jgi:hypothetical protein
MVRRHLDEIKHLNFQTSTTCEQQALETDSHLFKLIIFLIELRITYILVVYISVIK